MVTTRLVFGAGLAVAGLLAGGAAGAASRWVIQSTPNPSRTSFLDGVSCSSRKACTAVGAYQTGSGAFKTLAERWNGRNWIRQPTPNPAGLSPEMVAVSCPRATYCVAVGSTGDGLKTLAEQWNGRRWAVQASGTGGVGWLTGVSCISPSVCEAVGFSGFNGVLAERWNGARWKVQHTASPAGNSGLAGVSCPSAADCTAVGYTGTGGGTFAEQWNGRSWAVTATRSPSGFSFLYGVSCSAASACTATGYYETGGGNNKTLAERWNGRRWALQPTPRSTLTGTAVDLAAVSCPSSSDCIATGYHWTAAGQRVLAEQWNGRVWAIQRTADPKGTFSSQLNAVSCPSASYCMAVGSYDISFGKKTLAELWAVRPAR